MPDPSKGPGSDSTGIRGVIKGNPFSITNPNDDQFFLDLYAPRPDLEGPLQRAVSDGSFIVVAGQAGTGKTTLLRHLANTIRSNNPTWIQARKFNPEWSEFDMEHKELRQRFQAKRRKNPTYTLGTGAKKSVLPERSFSAFFGRFLSFSFRPSRWVKNFKPLNSSLLVRVHAG